ncbi:MAG: PAS domain S-box protein, partial [Chloroflexi bacterium]|nr:PAS domain S-box protein [Chloroflexota bacterium]
KESRAWLGATLHSIGDAVIATDANTFVKFMNPVAESLTGWKENEAIGKPLTDIFRILNEDTRQPVPNPAEKAMQEGRVVGLANHTLLIARDGREIHIDDAAAPILDNNGKVNGVVLTFRNITEKRRAEEAVRQSQAQLAAIINTAMDAVITIDANQNIILFNAAAERIFGYSAKEILGLPLNKLIPMRHQNAHGRDVDLFEKTNTTRRGHDALEVSGIRSDGDEFPLEVSIASIVVENKKFHTAVARDITERKSLEERLRKQNTYLNTLNEITLGLINRLNTKDLLQAVIAQAGTLIGSPNGFIDFFLPEEGVIEQNFSSGRYEQLNGFRHSIEEGVSGKIWKTAAPCVVNDYDSWPERASNLPKGMLRAVMGVPLKSGAQIIGVLGLEGDTTFNDEQVELLKRFAELASITLDNARLYTAAQQELLERKKTEATLRDSEERYRVLVENLPIGVYVSQSNKFVYANAAFTQMMEASTPSYLFGQTVSERIHPDERSRALDRAQALGTTDVTVPLIEERYIRLDGSILEAEATGTHTMFNGDPARQVVVIDIGERKRAEAALRKSEVQLRLIANNMLDVIAQTDMNGKIIYASPSHYSVLGYEPESLIGHNVIEFVHPDDMTRVMTAMRIGKETAGSGRLELQYRHAQGHYIWVETIGNALFDDHNEMVGAVFSSREVTKRKRAELQLERNSHQLAGLSLMGQTITATLDLEVIFRKIVDELMALLEAEEVYILLLEGDELVIAVTGGSDLQRYQGWRMPATEGVVGKAVQSGDSIRISEPELRKFVSRRSEDTVGHQVHDVLATPLRIGDQIIGVIEAAHTQADFFDENDLRLLESATLWASIAINNARHHAQTGRSLQESETLASISIALNEILDLDHILQMIVDAARSIVPKAARSVIHLIDEESVALRPVAISGLEHQHQPQLTMRPGEGVAGQVLASGQTINVGNIQNDSRYIPLRSDSMLGSILTAPIQSGPVTIGTVSIMSDILNAFTLDDERVLTRLGVQAALAIDKARAYEAERRRAEQAEALQQVMQRLIGHIDLTHAFQSVVDTIALVARYKYVRIFLIKETMLVLQAQNEKSKVTVQARQLNEGIVGRVARSGVATVVPNVALDPDYVEGMPETRSAIGVPLKRAQTVAGVLLIESNAERTLNANDLYWLVNIGQEISIAIENAELYSDLQEALQQEKAARTQLVRTEKLAGMGRLIASVAHELNNPLQAIQNALFLVKQEANLSGQAQDDLLVALSEADRMAELIGRLRETYRPTIAEKFQDGSLNVLVVETQRLIATHVRHRNINFDFSADPQLPLIPCVNDEIKQVLLNLSLNAVEAMGNGGQLTISTGHEADKSEVWVSVSDTGAGIDPTTIANIFDPFFTTKEGGTGLGLFITHEIVQKHGGRIEVQSQRGVGTTFKVSLPCSLSENR